MNYLNRQIFDLGADSQEDAVQSTQSLERKAHQVEQEMNNAGAGNPDLHNQLRVRLAEIRVQQNLPDDAWSAGYPAFSYFLKNRQWEQCVVVCDTLFRSGHDDALIALGQALWLSITFPVDPSLTVLQLQHVIEETPDESDGAAVAAAVAAYVADIRGDGNRGSDIELAVGQMLNDVARRHGHVASPDEFNAWFEKLELNDPVKILVRMRNIIDVLVQDQWWFDRNELQKLIPDGR